MNKIFKVLVCLFCASHSIAFAQHKTRVEVEAGANLSSFTGTGLSPLPSKNKGMKLGYQLGISVSQPIGRHWVIQSGLSLIQKTSEAKLGVYYHDMKPVWRYPRVQSRINYLMIPVTLGYDFCLSPKLHLIPNAGIYTAYGFNAGSCDIESKEASNQNVNTTQWKPLKGDPFLNSFSKYDYGISIGLKSRIGQHYTVSFNYLLGLKKSNNQYDLRNSTCQLSVGYLF